MPPLTGPPLLGIAPLDYSSSSNKPLGGGGPSEIKRKRRPPVAGKPEAGDEDKRKKRLKRGLAEEDTRSPVSGTFIRRLSDLEPLDAKRGDFYFFMSRRIHFFFSATYVQYVVCHYKDVKMWDFFKSTSTIFVSSFQ